MIKLTIKIADREITIEIDKHNLLTYYNPASIHELIKNTVEQALKLNA